MKKLMLIAVLAITGVQAQAKPREVLEAHLTKLHFQVDSDLAQRDISYASVRVDRQMKQVTLNLQPAFHCPQAAVCAMVMPQPIVVQLPIVKISRGSCGEVVYTAERNMMPVDGPAHKIEVIDNRQNYCEIFPLISTVVNYTIEVPRPYRKAEHILTGEYLTPIVPVEMANLITK